MDHVDSLVPTDQPAALDASPLDGAAPRAHADPDSPSVAEVAEVAGRIRANVERVIEGKPHVISAAVTVLLAEGHLLIEDVPGVGKTRSEERRVGKECLL